MKAEFYSLITTAIGERNQCLSPELNSTGTKSRRLFEGWGVLEERH